MKPTPSRALSNTDNIRNHKTQATNRILAAMFVFFSGFLGFMIWWKEFSWIGSFEESAVSFVGSRDTPNVRAFLSDETKPLVVHFVDPLCPCNRFSEPHINHLSIFKLRNTLNVIAYKTDPSERRLKLDVLPSSAQTLFDSWVPASPAVAIWDKLGQLAYFGPYSSGAICGRGSDLVLYTLDQLDKNNNPRWTNQEAVGCYCAW